MPDKSITIVLPNGGARRAEIPDDIAVAGFGDIDTSAMMHPPMTSVRPPLKQMAEAAVETIVMMIENDTEPREQQVFASQLIEREST